MLFYIQMKWNYQGRISQDKLWDLEALEGDHGVEGIRRGFVQLYKVVAQHRIIAIVNADSLDELDRNCMGWLPMREYLEFEVVWALRDYEGFLADVKAKFPLPDATVALPRPTTTTSLDTTRQTRTLAQRWFDALTHGQFNDAIACLDENVEWINYKPLTGYNDSMPWIGTFHGKEAVVASFIKFTDTCTVITEELVSLVADGENAAGVIHERSRVKATDLEFEIEFVQWLTVHNDKIVRWKSYTDPSPIIKAIRGDAS